MDLYDPGNVFAKILRGEIPNHRVYEDEDFLVCMDVMPISKGHCLVIPKAASRNLLDAAPGTLEKVLVVVQRIAQAAKAAFSADGVIVQQFNEAPAGQSVFHLHFHVVPVYEGVALLRHADIMADNNLLAEHAKSITSQL